MTVEHSIPPHAIASDWQRELPGAPTRSIRAVSSVKAIATILRLARDRALREHDIDAATLDLLSTLRRSGEPYMLTTRDLAERCLVTAGAISQRIARAEREGLVVRRPGEARRVEVELTAVGHRLVEKSAAHVLEADDALVAALDDDDLTRLEALLGRWEQAIRDQRSN